MNERKGNPLVVAEDAWLESAEGKSCADTLPTTPKYLENRLRRAFEAGWVAKEQHMTSFISIAQRLADPVQDVRNSDEP